MGPRFNLITSEQLCQIPRASILVVTRVIIVRHGYTWPGCLRVVTIFSSMTKKSGKVFWIGRRLTAVLCVYGTDAPSTALGFYWFIELISMVCLGTMHTYKWGLFYLLWRLICESPSRKMSWRPQNQRGNGLLYIYKQGKKVQILSSKMKQTIVCWSISWSFCKKM